MADFALTGNVIKATKFASFEEEPSSPSDQLHEVVLSGAAPGGSVFEAVLRIQRDSSPALFDPLQSAALGQQVTLEVTLS